jgi:hypothetical protein
MEDWEQFLETKLKHITSKKNEFYKYNNFKITNRNKTHFLNSLE